MIAIIAHDAGAANHIFAWIRSGIIDPNRLQLSLSGPALDIYKNTHPQFQNIAFDKVFSNASKVISGTGWSSDIEHQARKKTKELGLKSIAVIDHWTNYRARFNRNEEEILPDQIWVSDEYAVALCRRHLPELEVIQQPNALLEEQLAEIKTKPIMQHEARLLFVMEPARSSWGYGMLQGEFQAFDYFAQHINLLDISLEDDIVIKPHPSDPPRKYKCLIDQYPHLNLIIDEHSSLSELIASAATVVGCQTYAMVIALYADKKVISVLPPNAPNCVLPQKGIIHLTNLVAHK